MMEKFPGENMFVVTKRSWFADMVNFMVGYLVPNEYKWMKKNKLL